MADDSQSAASYDSPPGTNKFEKDSQSANTNLDLAVEQLNLLFFGQN